MVRYRTVVLVVLCVGLSVLYKRDTGVAVRRIAPFGARASRGLSLDGERAFDRLT